MSTYTLEGLADFILQLFDKESEDDLWEAWLHKDHENTFKDYKKKYFKKNTQYKKTIFIKRRRTKKHRKCNEIYKAD
ncbi:hypothetical protein [Carnobacterium jeotgali]|uniref:hypothetical protein n=1 Tax=Carnobacterium jeotgali TaxID=545534 RepID=UPI00054DA864|nr:hypothetical protein [Carnobacterium jeotgali]